jgi:hypothetical protein
MGKTFESRLVWEQVSTYQNRGDGLSVANEPRVLLWHPDFGVQLGRCFRWGDGDVITVSVAHGFTYTYFAEIDTPTEIGPYLGE